MNSNDQQRLLLQQGLLNIEQGHYPMNVTSMPPPQQQPLPIHFHLHQQLSPDPRVAVPANPSGFALSPFNRPLPLTSENEAARYHMIRMMVANEQEMKRQYEEFQFQRQQLSAQQNLVSNVTHTDRLHMVCPKPTEDAPSDLSDDDSLDRPETSNFPEEVAKTPNEEESPPKKIKAARQAEEKKPRQAPKKDKPRKKDTKWLSTYEELKDFKKSQGTCIVPRGYALNPRLASWVAEQRKQYKLLKDGKQSSITPERVALLNELDFAWNAQEAAWARHMKDLKTFREKTGHCHVPLNHQDYPKLGLWVKEQRRHYTLLKQGKPSHMTPERAAELDKIGFCWDTHEATWLERLRELTDFKEKYGNCIVPTNFTDNPKLGTWVHHQRRQYKKFKEGKPCHITEERINALENLGFVWFPREKSHADQDDSSESGTDLSSLDFRPRKRKRKCKRST